MRNMQDTKETATVARPSLKKFVIREAETLKVTAACSCYQEL